jgi:replicative DNA helicase
MSEVVDAPLFIDDSEHVEPVIGAKCRRLKQPLDLQVIVDYLQLRPAPAVGNRQQEVSEMSRSPQLLAEVDVPVVAISRLGRGPEQRGG